MFKKFMGGVAAALSIPIAIVGGAGAGALKSIEDGSLNSFSGAFEKAAGGVVECAKEIGEEYGPGFVTTVGAIVIGGSITEQIHKKS